MKASPRRLSRPRPAADFSSRDSLLLPYPIRLALCLLMGHLDVVGVDKTKWTVDPFGAVVKDGYLYGRGAIDDKG